MKRSVLALAAAGAFAIAMPAVAQTSADINNRQAMLDARITQSLQNRTMSAEEAASLRAQFNEIANLEVRYRDSDGLQTAELIDLDRRLAGLESRIRVARVDAPPAPGYGQAIDRRQDELDRRIDQGVRDGSLTTDEALRLRAEFRDLAGLEARYRADGTFGAAERADLDRRFAALNNRIRIEQTDAERAGGYANQGPPPGRGYDDRAGPAGPWQSINLRQATLDRRIDRGVRDGSLTRGEAVRLRAEFQQIVQLERRYRTTAGLQAWERVDLDRRFDRLSSAIRDQRSDGQGYDRRDDRGGGIR